MIVSVSDFVTLFLILTYLRFLRRRPQDADAAKEKTHKRRGAAPPLKVLLF